MLEWLSPAFLYGVGKDILSKVRPNRKRLSPEARMALHEKWRPLFAQELNRWRADKLRHDVIIHDVSRSHDYPEVKDAKRRISSWFRVALVGQYHKGIEVALNIHSIVFEETENSWRLAAMGEEGTEKAYVIGYIPYESIVSVNWEGDEYYNYPHIFCHFEYGKQPYEKVMFCEERTGINGWPYYSELAKNGEVKLTSQKFGTAWAWVEDN